MLHAPLNTRQVSSSVIVVARRREDEVMTLVLICIRKEVEDNQLMAIGGVMVMD